MEVKSLSKEEERKQTVSGSILITELTAAKVPAFKAKYYRKEEYHEIEH